MTALTMGKLQSFGLLFKAWLCKEWPLFVGFLVCLFGFNHFFTIGVNVTESLPNKVFLVLKQDHAIGRGDYVAFRWEGGDPYPNGLTFVKIVKGVEGDVVSMDEQRQFFVNGDPVGVAKEKASIGYMAGRPLVPGPTGVIPKDHYYVMTPHKDSLDSRYMRTGWVDAEKVVGRAVPIL